MYLCMHKPNNTAVSLSSHIYICIKKNIIIDIFNVQHFIHSKILRWSDAATVAAAHQKIKSNLVLLV
jgi:hypothetical protein